jgi:DNA-binding LacI/PurR family transcriptional regulator
MPPPAESRESRPTLRTIARAAGVSAMTVSRVLRNLGAISPARRAQVKKIAAQLGYRPDPAVAKLMYHLRNRRKPSFQGSICAITAQSPNEPLSDYAAGVVAGARKQAEAHGYAFSMLYTETTPDASRNLQRMLRSRGIEGVLLLPMGTPGTLHRLLDWREFSVVATTSSVLAPDFNRVMPHHFKNAQLLCQSLDQLGYRRIGLVQTFDHVQRIYHAIGAAVMWHSAFNRDRVVAPFIYREEPVGLARWFRQEKPDVIVGITERFCLQFAEQLGLQIPGPIGFATTSTQPGARCAGIDQLPRQLGVASIDLLTAMIQRGEKGVPAIPATTQLLGRWVTGPSCPALPKTDVPVRAAGRKRARMIFFSP